MLSKLLVVDVETTGLNPQLHNLLELTLLYCEGPKIVDTLSLKIAYSTYYVSSAALKVNRIDLSQHTGVTPVEAVEQITLFVRKYFPNSQAMLAGHNTPFDVGFLKALFDKTSIHYSALFSHRLIDTSSVCRFLNYAGILKTHGSLSDIAEQLGIKVDTDKIHTSLEDAKLTHQVLLKLIAFCKPLKRNDVKESSTLV